MDDGNASVVQKIQELLQDRGFFGLYRGMFPVLQTVGISQFLYFYIFAYTKTLRIGDRLMVLAKASGGGSSSSSGLQSFIGSLVAGVLNMAFTEPLWKANVFCQTQIKKAHAVHTSSASVDSANTKELLDHNQEGATTQTRVEPEVNEHNVFAVVLYLAKKHGLGNLWSGLATSMYLVSNPVINYAMYDVLKTRAGVNGGQISAAKAFFLGALSKAVATVLTYPLQVAQSRLRASTENISMFQALRDIYAKDKVSGYFKGMGAKLMQTVLNSAFMFFFLEALLNTARRFRS